MRLVTEKYRLKTISNENTSWDSVLENTEKKHFLSCPPKRRLSLNDTLQEQHIIYDPASTRLHVTVRDLPDSKVHDANMGTTWFLSAPQGPHVGPMNQCIIRW